MKRVVAGWSRRVLAVLACWGLIACDGGGAQRQSQFERFVGTWAASTLKVDDFDVTSQLNDRYDSLEITFASTGEGIGTYEIRGTKDGTNILAVRGPVQLVNDNALVFERGFTRRVFWTFEFETSRRLTLRSSADRDSGTTEFLQRLLPGQSWGERPEVDEFRLLAEDP